MSLVDKQPADQIYFAVVIFTIALQCRWSKRWKNGWSESQETQAEQEKMATEMREMKNGQEDIKNEKITALQEQMKTEIDGIKERVGKVEENDPECSRREGYQDSRSFRVSCSQLGTK